MPADPNPEPYWTTMLNLFGNVATAVGLSGGIAWMLSRVKSLRVRGRRLRDLEDHETADIISLADERVKLIFERYDRMLAACEAKHSACEEKVDRLEQRIDALEDELRRLDREPPRTGLSVA